MTIKQLCRKRNKLVVLCSKLKGEEKKSVDLAIRLIDLILDDEI
jgi:hypothetical protein